MTEEATDYKEYTLETDSELRFEIEDKNAKVHVTVGKEYLHLVCIL